jgi:hypothetical protein
MHIIKLLYLLLYMTACSGFYYLGAIGFVRTIGFVGRKLKGKIYLKAICFLLIWPAAVAVVVVPFVFAAFYQVPADLVWFTLVCLTFLASLLPAVRYIRKNMEILYEAGYAKRR